MFFYAREGRGRPPRFEGGISRAPRLHPRADRAGVRVSIPGQALFNQERKEPMIATLTAGLLLGSASGLSPGPLLAFVISQSIRHSAREGVKAAFVPLLTDLPIILLTLTALTFSPRRDLVIGLISLAGGLYLLYLALECLRISPVEVDTEKGPARSLTKGTLINFLSPSPWLFWLTVGGPQVLRAVEHDTLAPLYFCAGFYLPLVGSKVLIALAAGKSRGFLRGKLYLYIMRLLGVALAAFALLTLRDGLHLLRP
jgi:threonine/homoserine/homoserine lactone efflux protein